MNEKLQYAEMLEIPVNTCSVHFVPPKRKKRIKKLNNEEIKNQLIEQVNNTPTEQETPQLHVENEEIKCETVDDNQTECNETVKIHAKQKTKKFNVIAVQFIAIGILVLGIFLTNVFLPQSGINSLIGEVFGVTTTTSSTDTRVYSQFQPTVMASGIKLTNGVITLSGKGSVYSACDGKVSAVNKTDDNLFSLEITHSNNFKSVLSGLNYVYCNVGDRVFKTIPVGYTDESASMCFYNGDSIITDYTLSDNSVVWAI